MSVSSFVSTGVALAILSAGIVPAGADADSSSVGGESAPTVVLPLTTAQSEPTAIATGALQTTTVGSGGSTARRTSLTTLSQLGASQDALDPSIDAAILTDPLEVSPFLVTGLTWDGPSELPSDTDVYIRVRENGEWSEWYLTEAQESARDDGVGASGTEPFVTGEADGIQVRVTGDVEDLPASLSLTMVPDNPQGEEVLDDKTATETSAPATTVNPDSLTEDSTAPVTTTPGATATPESVPTSSDDEGSQSGDLDVTSQSGGASPSGTGSSMGSSTGSLSLSSIFPASTTANNLPVAVSSRADWGADEAKLTWKAEYARASFVVVHHTAGTNSYSMDESASVVRAIYHYHAVTLGWGDIGYNFLVDKWGRAFEGRSGSLAAPSGQMSIGAHDRGFNTGTMGISMMGDYSSITPSNATLDTVGKLAGWLLSRAGVSATGSGSFTPTLSNGKLVKGETITVNRVSGHRDTYPTSCPGDAGYAQLSRIRSAAAATKINTSPIGFLDKVAVGRGSSIDVIGWAFDADTDFPLPVDLSVDGTYAGRLTANVARTDVQAALGLRAEVGYSTNLAVSAGRHTVCTRAINHPTGDNPRLGCKTVDVTHDPRGHLDKVSAETSGQIQVIGWAYDSDTTSAVSVALSIDGKRVAVTSASAQRSDVASALGIRSTVGYSTLLQASSGSHQVCAIALNVGEGKDQAQECKTVVVNSLPVGFLDKVALNSSGGIDVIGWAFDSDTTSALRVDLSVDGVFKLALIADQPRADVNKVLGIRKTVGYRTVLSLQPGKHTVCTRAHNVPTGDNPRLGCRDVVVRGGFNAGAIISDSKMFAADTMNATQIQTFLAERNPTCAASPSGTKCLKDFTATTSRMTASYCKDYAAGTNERASTIISKAASACGINPQVLLVMLQKEQGLVTATGVDLTTKRYSQALGFRMSNSAYASFPAQVYNAAAALVEYGERSSSYTYRAGQTASIAYHPNTSCGASSVLITNRATAALYNYTPYQPNAAALSNMYSIGDACSSYGNRNFWRYFTDWFGSTI